MRYGSYDTFDVPCLEDWRNNPNQPDLDKEALAWLKEEFEKIGGTVRRIMNPHDFGSYPSFEIDYPDHLAPDFCEVDENTDILLEKEEWAKKTAEIHDRYYQKYEDLL
jgi:hypothetical protein